MAAHWPAQRRGPVSVAVWHLHDSHLATAELAGANPADQDAVAGRQSRDHAVPGHGDDHESLPQRNQRQQGTRC
ncbi:MAG TPA: hypothetical protein VKS82_08390 [Streptosporangiaceae bacterium]|nr:hypothetical protein [Streptosporangiaceae bacterium]